MMGKAEIQGYDFLDSEVTGMGIRAFGLLGDISPWLLSLFAVFSYQNKKYLLFLFFAGSCVIGASLGASFTLFFSLVLFFLFNNRNKFYSLVITVIFFSMLLLLYNYFDNILLFNRLKGINNDSSSFQRSFTWLKSLDMIYESPLYGHGYGSFYYYMTYNNPNLDYAGGAVSNANNQFLQILFDGGVLLLVTYFIVIIKVLKIVKDKVVWGLNQDKYLSMKKAFYIWLLSFIISNQTMVFIIPSTIWVVIIIFVGMSYHINKYNIKDENFTLNS
jgi:O-antigen ligase